MKTYDAIVVGGGPAGLVAAARLAEAGAATAVLDPQAPWEKPCGGGLSPVALDLFPWLADLEQTSRRVSRVRLTSVHGASVTLEGQEPYFVLSRRELAGGLLARAQEAGAEHLPFRAQGVARDGSTWLVNHPGGQVRGRFLVGADGVASVVRRTVRGAFERSDLGVAMGYHLSGCPLNALRLRFQRPEGFAYLFPRRDTASLGVGWRASFRGGRASSRRLLEWALRSWAPGASIVGRYSHAFPSIVSREGWAESRVGEGWTLVGDAAGHVDPVRGEGIIYAMWGASLLADAVIEGRPETYEDRWRDAFGGSLWRKLPKRWVLRVPGLAGAGILLARPFPRAREYLYRRSQHHS
jgi:geranylgeranyl reductase